MATDWYDNKHELEPGQVFTTKDGLVKLDRRVPGDATKWYMADWLGGWLGGWSYNDSTVEASDLIELVTTGL